MHQKKLQKLISSAFNATAFTIAAFTVLRNHYHRCHNSAFIADHRRLQLCLERSRHSHTQYLFEKKVAWCIHFDQKFNLKAVSWCTDLNSTPCILYHLWHFTSKCQKNDILKTHKCCLQCRVLHSTLPQLSGSPVTFNGPFHCVYMCVIICAWKAREETQFVVLVEQSGNGDFTTLCIEHHVSHLSWSSIPS